MSQHADSLASSKLALTAPVRDASGRTTETVVEPDKSFAHDINAKMDTIANDLGQLDVVVANAEQRLTHALGDLKSRTAHLTEALQQLYQRIDLNDTRLASRCDEMDARVSETVASIGAQLGGLDQRLVSHHRDIEVLRRDLERSGDDLDKRLSSFQVHTQSRLNTLFETQEKQQKTQRILSDDLDVVQAQANSNTADAFNLRTDLSRFERIVGERFRNSAVVVGLAFSLIIAAMALLHWVSPQIDEVVQKQLQDFRGVLAEEYPSRHDTSRLESMFTATTSDLSSQVESVTALVNTEMRSVNEELEALQYSVYGPADTALPVTELSIHDAGWIATRDQAHYTIQLVGVYRESGMRNFVNRHTNSLAGQPLFFKEGEYRGQPWFNLFYGDFASFTAAQMALDELPSALQKNAPWVRRIGAIQ